MALTAPPPCRADYASAGENALARAYQLGDLDALPALWNALQGLIAPSLRQAKRARVWPPTMESSDVDQEAWRLLAELVRRWDPALGDIGAYVRASLPWLLRGALRAQSASRWTARVRVSSVGHTEALAAAERHGGEDGRDWARRLALAECLAALGERERQAVLLVDVCGLNESAAARRLGVTRATLHRANRQGLEQLRLWWIGDAPLPRSLPSARERLLAVLVAHASHSGQLPGRAVVCREAGVSQKGYARLMRELEREGRIVERAARRPGRLTERQG